MHKCKHFKIQELVSPIVCNKWGDKAWMFFDEDFLKDLDTIREHWGRAIIINNWATGGNLKQCGLRSNLDDLVKNKKTLYLSAHCMGKAVDMHDTKGSNKALFNLVYNLIEQKKLKKIKRLENLVNTPTWVHADQFQADKIVF